MHVLLGAVRTGLQTGIEQNRAVPLQITVIPTTVATTKTDWAMGFGGGIDLDFGEKRPRRYAVRVFQFDYIPTRGQASWLNSFRIQGGFVLRFGHSEK